MEKQIFYTDAVEAPLLRAKAKVRPLTSRLRKSKNFWKVDRMLDDYIDRTSLLKSGPKRLLKKLLVLRSQEDDNQVKVTVSGLSVLLDVNVKTIRLWLKNLLDAEFLYPQGEIWDPHCNYPKKLFVFPVTFPGFDAAAVFIRKGARAKFKARLSAPNQVKAKLRKVARLRAQSTCPVAAPLLDCSPPTSRRGTRNNKKEEDTKVSSPPTPSFLLIPTSKSGFAARQPVCRPNTFKEKRAGQGPELPIPPKPPKSVVDLSPRLKGLLVTILAQAKCKGKIHWVSNFIDDCADENSTLRTREDLRELANDLCTVLPKQFEPYRVNVLTSLFRFLRDYIENFTGYSFYRSSAYGMHMLSRSWRHDEAHQAFLKRYPSCVPDRHTDEGRTGVNRVDY